jgi:hypothetical protein
LKEEEEEEEEEKEEGSEKRNILLDLTTRPLGNGKGRRKEEGF